METAFWLQRWQDRQIGFHQQQINSQLQDYWHRIAADGDETVLVPLCGKTLDMLWLAAQGFRVLGVEVSTLAVEDFFHENGLQPDVQPQGAFQHWKAGKISVLCGDFFDLDRGDVEGVGSVYDRASLIALPAQMRLAYVQKLRSLFPSSPPTLLITLEYRQSQMPGPPFSVDRTEIDRLYADYAIIEPLRSQDALEQNPQFRRKGLTALIESAYRLRPRPAG